MAHFRGHFVGSLPAPCHFVHRNRMDELSIASLSYRNIDVQFENLAGLGHVRVLHFVRNHLVHFEVHFVGNSCFADLFGCHSKPFVTHEVVFAVSTCSICYQKPGSEKAGRDKTSIRLQMARDG